MSKLKARVLAACAAGAILTVTGVGMGGVAQAAPSDHAPGQGSSQVVTVTPDSSVWR